MDVDRVYEAVYVVQLLGKLRNKDCFNLVVCTQHEDIRPEVLKRETNTKMCCGFVCALYECRHVWSFIWKIKIFMSSTVTENRITC